MTDELKPCAHCLGGAVMKKEPGCGGMAERPAYFWVECVRCGLSSRRYSDYLVNPKAEAIAAWNRRSAPAVTDEMDISRCSQTTQALIRMLIERDRRGLAKYGQTLDRDDLTHAEWLQHMAEEMLDGAGYALAAIRTTSA